MDSSMCTRFSRGDEYVVDKKAREMGRNKLRGLWEKLTRAFYAKKLTRSAQPFALFLRPLLPIPPSRFL